MACIDRCLSCSMNARLRRLSNITITRRIVLIIIGVWLILPIHMLIFSNIQNPGNIACSVTNDDVAIYHRFYTIIMGGVLPSIIAFICSLFIWRYLHERRTRRIFFCNNKGEKRNKIRDQQVLFMLLVQVTIFLVSTIPFMSFNVYDTLTRSVANKSPDRKAIEAFLKTLTEFLIYLITLSFYSNTLVSRTFRKESIALFKVVIYCGHQQRSPRISPSNRTAISNTTRPMTTMITTKTLIPAIGETGTRK